MSARYVKPERRSRKQRGEHRFGAPRDGGREREAAGAFAEHREGPTGKRRQPPRPPPHERAVRERPHEQPKRVAEVLPAPLAEGEWLWTTREGYERDLIQELATRRSPVPARVVGPALVASKHVAGIEPTFARQGFPVAAMASAATLPELASALADKISSQLVSAKEYLLDVWVPDATATNPLAGRAEQLESLFMDALGRRCAAVRVPRGAPSSDIVPYVQACLLAPTRAAAGVLSSRDAISLAPGGRTRTRAPRGKPSRSARKLVEAFAWLGTSPGPGDLCVDLGAAPGGWSFILLDLGARVVAVDPARLRIEGRHEKRLRHIQASAFTYEPEEPADWLFCDMAFRPLDVAALLARWARSRWATLLVANFKLPMKRKAEMLQRLISILERAGWRDVKSKQLYHDRDEVTVTAHL